MDQLLHQLQSFDSLIENQKVDLGDTAIYLALRKKTVEQSFDFDLILRHTSTKMVLSNANAIFMLLNLSSMAKNPCLHL